MRMSLMNIWSSKMRSFLTVLGIDTNKELKSWKALLVWLESQLRELRSVAWPRVVIGHHTLVSYSNHGFTDYMMTEFEPMFSKYGVSA